jgi:hypothetical protein
MYTGMPRRAACTLRTCDAEHVPCAITPPCAHAAALHAQISKICMKIGHDDNMRGTISVCSRGMEAWASGVWPFLHIVTLGCPWYEQGLAQVSADLPYAAPRGVALVWLMHVQRPLTTASFASRAEPADHSGGAPSVPPRGFLSLVLCAALHVAAFHCPIRVTNEQVTAFLFNSMLIFHGAL